MVFVAVSRYGSVKLGPEHSTPDYGVFSWAAMLFAAGIGIDLMFFSVAGPVSHYLAPPGGEGQTVEAARQAVVWTLFHYGITGWSMYALMGLALAYFSFRYRLPLAIRSALYPIIGKRIHGRFGDTVDIAAILGTVFGISVSLGIGVVQLNYGLNFMFGIPEGIAAQIGLIILAAFMATASAVSGVDKGIRRLSQLNVILAGILMLYILVLGDPASLLNALILNIGDYISRLPAMTLNTFAYDEPFPIEWLNDWTLFFWAWWIAWAPFVGLFWRGSHGAAPSDSSWPPPSSYRSCSPSRSCRYWATARSAWCGRATSNSAPRPWRCPNGVSTGSSPSTRASSSARAWPRSSACCCT